MTRVRLLRFAGRRGVNAASTGLGGGGGSSGTGISAGFLFLLPGGRPTLFFGGAASGTVEVGGESTISGIISVLISAISAIYIAVYFK